MSDIIKLNAESVYNYLIDHTNDAITYGHMEKLCGLDTNIQSLQKITKVLDLIMMYNVLRNEPFLSALVVNKKGILGSGFFETLEYLNVHVHNKNGFHQEELQKIRNYNWQEFRWND